MTKPNPPLSIYRISIKKAATHTRFCGPYTSHFAAIDAAIRWLQQTEGEHALHSGIRIMAKRITQGDTP